MFEKPLHISNTCDQDVCGLHVTGLEADDCTGKLSPISLPRLDWTKFRINYFLQSVNPLVDSKAVLYAGISGSWDRLRRVQNFSKSHAKT